MKKLLAIFLVFLCVKSFAEVKLNLEITCVTSDELFVILKEYEEVPFSIGQTLRDNQSDENATMFFVNPNTLTWTMVEKLKLNNSIMYCVLAAGSKYQIIFKRGRGS